MKRGNLKLDLSRFDGEKSESNIDLSELEGRISKLERVSSLPKLSPKLERTLVSPKLSPKLSSDLLPKLKRAPVKLKLNLNQTDKESTPRTDMFDLSKFKKEKRTSADIELEKVDKLFETLKSLAPIGNINDNYIKIDRELASGAFGVVNFYYKRDDLTEKMYIVKRISYLKGDKKETYERLINEILALKKVQENNCKDTNLIDLCFIEVFRDDKDIYIVTQFKNETESLQSYMKTHTFTSKQIANYLFILLNKLKIIHLLNIVHNDVKPGNILVQYNKDGIVDLSYIDYGESCLCDNNNKCTTFGTLKYKPAEYAVITRGECNLTFYNDIYSLGIIINELLQISNVKNDMLEIFIKTYMTNEDMYDNEYTIGYLNNLIDKFSIVLNKINETDISTI